MTFHRWIGAGDEPGEDMCYVCGVVTPDFSDDPVVADHGPLPITCPGPLPDRAHRFVAHPDGIECDACRVLVTDRTLPVNVDWECVPARPVTRDEFAEEAWGSATALVPVPF